MPGTLDVLEDAIGSYISEQHDSLLDRFQVNADSLYVAKYMNATWLSRVLDDQRLYASNEPGFTWGDAVYVAPLITPFQHHDVRRSSRCGDVGHGQLSNL